MAITVQKLDELDADVVAAATAFAQQLLLEKNPSIDTKRGVIGELVIGLDAILNGASNENIERVRQSSSLQEIEENPALADNNLVDAVLSNFRVTRKVAQAAKGEVTIVLSQLVAVTIAAGAIFEADGQQFTSDAAFAARTDAANVLDDNDRLITQTADDQFSFTIDVTAVVAGSVSLLRKDTQLVPLQAPTSFVKSFAASDFGGAVDLQSNADFIKILEEGLAARAFSNRVNVVAMIKEADAASHELGNDEFPNIIDMSIVGYGDPEMVRDQHWLFPVSGGGRVDLYLRSQQLYQSQLLTKTATLVDKTADGGIWQFSIAREEAPGFYQVSRVQLTSADSGFEVTADIRGVNLTGDVYVPDVDTVEEAVYSRFQAATIRFLDTETDATGLTENSSTREYLVTVDVMPLVQELQEFLGDRSIRSPQADILVRAAVPCFLSLSFEIQKRRADVTIDEDVIKTALATYVNTTGFPGRLYASALCQIVEDKLVSFADVRAIDMVGRIRRPNGTIKHIRSDEVLIIPDEPVNALTGRTVIFLLDSGDIGITITSVDVPQV